MHEIKVLKQLKDSKTKNVNIILDAFQIHSQLWIVNEYCPGGSVRTLVCYRLAPCSLNILIAEHLNCSVILEP